MNGFYVGAVIVCVIVAITARFQGNTIDGIWFLVMATLLWTFIEEKD